MQRVYVIFDSPIISSIFLLKTLSVFIAVCISHETFSQKKIGISLIHEHNTLIGFTTYVNKPENIIDSIHNYPNAWIFSSNWVPRSSFTQIEKKTSTFDFSQSNFDVLSRGHFSLIVTSIAPTERAHLDNWIKRLIAKYGGMPKLHMRSRMKPYNTPFDYFISEYYYLVGQNNPQDDRKGIEVAIDSVHLRKIIADGINTPLVISVEGLNALMGKFLSKRKNFQDIRHRKKQKKLYDRDYKLIAKELMENLDSMLNLEHRIFFVAPTHHNWSYICGQARYFDKDEDVGVLGGSRNLIVNWLVPFRKGKRKFGSKLGCGIIDIVHQKHKRECQEHFFNIAPDNKNNVCDCNNFTGKYSNRKYRIGNICWDKDHIQSTNIGLPIIEKLLDPSKNKFHKPVYIDVKHMDVEAVDQYIKIVKQKRKEGIFIPIIASHTAASGKNFNLAYLTGMPPISDNYSEITNPNFYDENEFITLLREHNIPDISSDIVLCKNNAGWFYPFSLNLYDEEISEIYESDGIIGLIMDERILGAYSYNYQTNKYISDFNTFVKLKKLDSLESFQFKELIPFYKNMFYIILKCGVKNKKAWDHLSLGTDFDGLVDPLDVCLNLDAIGDFEQLVIKYFDLYMEFDNIGENLKFGLSSTEIVEKVFRTNAYDFTLKYF